jgi:hypothetical protein
MEEFRVSRLKGPVKKETRLWLNSSRTFFTSASEISLFEHENCVVPLDSSHRLSIQVKQSGGSFEYSNDSITASFCITGTFRYIVEVGWIPELVAVNTRESIISLNSAECVEYVGEVGDCIAAVEITVFDAVAALVDSLLVSPTMVSEVVILIAEKLENVFDSSVVS